jgi:hypothetical protein
MKKLILLVLLIPPLCFAQGGETSKSQARPLIVDQTEVQYNESQIEILKSKKIIVCYALRKPRFDKYADLDTVLGCTTYNNLGAHVTLENIYSWGFKLIQIVDVPPQTDPKKVQTVPLYYFDKR